MIEENNLDPDTVKLIISDGGRFWRQFLRWLLIYRFIKSDKTGEKLIKKICKKKEMNQLP